MNLRPILIILTLATIATVVAQRGAFTRDSSPNLPPSETDPDYPPVLPPRISDPVPTTTFLTTGTDRVIKRKPVKPRYKPGQIVYVVPPWGDEVMACQVLRSTSFTDSAMPTILYDLSGDDDYWPEDQLNSSFERAVSRLTP